MGKTKRKDYDFSGYVARYGVKCTDGTVIHPGCFAHNDGDMVSLFWNHDHGDPSKLLGNVVLEERDDGVYGYGSFNESDAAKAAKLAMAHGDISALSIYANHLQRKGNDIYHGDAKEVSCVISGADPTAYVDYMSFAHSDGYDPIEIDDEDFEAYIYTGGGLTIAHSDMGKEDKEVGANSKIKHSEDDTTTVQDVIDTMDDDQKDVMFNLIQAAANGELDLGDDDTDDEDADDTDEGEPAGDDDEVKHSDNSEEEDAVGYNVFENDGENSDKVISHSDMNNFIEQAKKSRMSLKDILAENGVDDAAPANVIAHGDQNYGITPVDYLFPNEKNFSTYPDFIQRKTDWVGKFMGRVHHTPFSRVRTIHANITEDEARARGYLKGKQKKDEVFTLLKRSTSPQTIYKRQKMDRDDIIDIDIDVVPWIKGEMRQMLDEEIARACLIGDGRPSSSDDKIHEDNIRPAWTDDELYTIKAVLELAKDATEDEKAKQLIRLAVKSRKQYRGSGDPILFTTEDNLTDMLLLEDVNGRVIYDSITKLATAMRVSGIVTVPVMENQTRTVDGKVHNLEGIIVNPDDYNIGADKGGAVATFDDFDINFNQMVYLMETRCSGALVKPYSAIALESTVATA